MEKIQLKILGISTGNVSSSYTLILEEVNGDRKLPIIIGILEAQAIAIEIEKIEPLRPMTHDLFKSFAGVFNIRMKEIIIHKLFEGIFYSYLVVTDGTIIKNIDSRTSDAIALALRFNCPIYTYEKVLSEAGINVKALELNDIQDNSEKESPKQSSKQKPMENLESYSIPKLRKMLSKAISEEDYITAAKLRDTIKKIEHGGNPDSDFNF